MIPLLAAGGIGCLAYGVLYDPIMLAEEVARGIMVCQTVLLPIERP